MAEFRKQGEYYAIYTEEHKKYSLLPLCRLHGGEVFSYPAEIVDELEKYLPHDTSLIPYGYKNYEEYFSKIDKYIDDYLDNEELAKKFIIYKKLIKEMNIKSEWSVLRYIGESIPEITGLTKGQVYYWPCSRNKPVYEGVIDDEEFTSYLYPTDSTLWEILEDPTGMAHRTIYGI